MSYRHQARGRPRTDRHRGNARPEARDSQPGRHVPLVSKAIEFHRTVTRWLSREGAGRSPAMKFLTTAAIALVAATTAQAAEIKRIGGDISITGMITPGDAAKFKAIAANIGGRSFSTRPEGTSRKPLLSAFRSVPRATPRGCLVAQNATRLAL
jgi:hypothetical protein